MSGFPLSPPFVMVYDGQYSAWRLALGSIAKDLKLTKGQLSVLIKHSGSLSMPQQRVIFDICSNESPRLPRRVKRRIDFTQPWFAGLRIMVGADQGLTSEQ